MNIRNLVATAVLLCAPISVLAQTVSIPEPLGYVNDFANQLKPEQRKALDDKLKAYEQKSTIQFVVYITPSLSGESKEQFSQAVADKWKIGKKGKDNGLLLLWAPTERQYFLEVGYGLEGSLTDGATGQILRDHLVPHLKINQGYEGLNETVDAVIAHLGDQTEVAASTVQHISFYPTILIWIGIGFGVLLMLWYIVYQARLNSESDDDTTANDSPEPRAHWSDRQSSARTPRSQTRHYTERSDDTESPTVNAAAAIVAAEALSRSERDEEESSHESHTSEESESDESSTSSSPTTPDFSGGGGDMGGGGAGGSY